MSNHILKEQFENGRILLINKELNWTSFDVVNKTKILLKRYCGIQKIKVGHAGTLDPLATGLVIVCTGKETKNIIKYQDYNKEYIAEFKIGETTPSFDLETEVDEKYPTEHINLDLIKKQLNNFVGKLMQVPPVFSAKQVNGRRAYDYARKGKTVKLEPKQIEIEGIDIISFEMPKLILKILCSKGTYIRALARDFGIALKSGAYLSGLIRTAIGNYKLSDAITINELEKKLILNQTF